MERMKVRFCAIVLQVYILSTVKCAIFNPEMKESKKQSSTLRCTIDSAVHSKFPFSAIASTVKAIEGF